MKEPTNNPIRVAVIEANDLLRAGLTSLLEQDAFDCVASWRNAREALVGLPAARPEILLIDINHHARSAMRIQKRLPSISPETRAILLISCALEAGPVTLVNLVDRQAQDEVHVTVSSARDERLKLQIARHLGTVGFVHNHLRIEDVAHIVRKTHCSPGGGRGPAIGDSLARGLTPREREIAQLVAQGRSNKEIAFGLGMAYSTVKNHVSSVMDKLGLEHRTQIAVLASRLTG